MQELQTSDAFKAAYEARDLEGEISGAIRARDWNRFTQTLRYLPPDARSLLDAGCDRGHWLHYVTTSRRLERHLGVDVSENRVAEARRLYPGLHVKAGYLEQLQIEPRSYEVVTCLEVLEHIPEWLKVLEALLRIASRTVVATVPYRQKLVHTVCIHCGKLAPLYGHLHTYDESSFPAIPGWNLRLGYIKDYGIGSPLARRIYRTFRPRRNWLVACYEAAPPLQS